MENSTEDLKVISISKNDLAQNTNAKFEFNELPFDQLAKVGLDKDAFLKLSDENIVSLLSGRRSDLIRFSNLEVDGNKLQPLDTKISLERDIDGSVSVAFHPINKSIVNEFKLSDIELKDLLSGKVPSVLKEIPSKAGELQTVVVQYDKEINGFVAERQKNIVAPEEINNTKLSDDQKKAFTKGEEIEVNGEKVNVDLKGVLGFAGKIAMFGLDGGITMIIMAIIKHEREKTELQKKAMAAMKAPGTGTENGKIISIGAEKIAGNKTRESISGFDNNTPHWEKLKHRDTLLEHGADHFEHNKENKPSYYVKLSSPNGERTVWGVGLKDAIEQSGAKVGDQIILNNLGKRDVQVEQHKRDETGKIVGSEIITAHRNEWEIKPLVNPQNFDFEQGVSGSRKMGR
ncbi:MAG: DUF4099 domain-containing protein [Bacteroidota bacterium]